MRLHKKNSPIWILIILSSNSTIASELPTQHGSLIFADPVGDAYHTLSYRAPSGTVKRPFLAGLRYQDDNVTFSTDQSYATVNFSEPGEGPDGAIGAMYLCAFVRMNDGCVIEVHQDNICGGIWTGTSTWTYNKNKPIEVSEIKPQDPSQLLESYRSGYRRDSQSNGSEISAYVTEGTTLENSLICSSRSATEEKTLAELADQLEEDKDLESASQIRTFLDNQENSGPAQKTESITPGSWKQATILHKSYIYSKKNESGITKKYLIPNDSITIQNTYTREKFVKFRYVAEGGKLIAGWVKCADVEGCSP